MSDSTATENVIKRYIVKDIWKDFEVTLEVDHSILTEERATMINEFWSDHDDRLLQENGNVVRAVIRLAGTSLINTFLDGGASFSDTSIGDYVSSTFHNEEGWGGTVAGSAYGWCGIRVIAADVEQPCFDDVALVEVAL